MLAIVGICALVTRQPPARHARTALPLAARGLVSRTLGAGDPRMAARPADGGYALANAGVRASLMRSGAVVRAAGASWQLGLRTVAGRKVAAVDPVASRNAVTYVHGGVREWYVNGPLGLEQGFTLARRPAWSRTGPLTLGLGRLPTGARIDGGSVVLSVHGRDAVTYRGLYATDSRGRSLPARIERVGGSLVLRVDDRAARYPVVVDPFIQAARLTASDGAADDNLGQSVAVSGDGTTIVAGAAYATAGANAQAGAVYVFTRAASGWATSTETAKLTASDGAAGDEFGTSVGISGNGSTIVVGSPYAQVGSTVEQGALYVFVKPASGWATTTQTARLTTSDGATGDHLGYGYGLGIGVSSDGSTIAAGAPDHNSHTGEAYVFVRPGGGWADGTQAAVLTASDAAGGDELGYGLALSGDGTTVVAGSPFKDSNAGAAYVFVEPGAGWSDAVQDAKLTATNGAAQDTLGISLSASQDGSTIAAGAYSAYIDSVQGVGAVYVFSRPNGGWADVSTPAKLTASDGAQYDNLGTSVAIQADGSAILAGAPQAQIGGHLDQGAAYLFARPSGGWVDGTEASKLVASDGRASDRFGYGVAVSASGALVAGATGATVGTNAYQGAVYAFIVPTTTSVSCQPAAVVVGSPTTCTATVSGGTGSVTLTSDSPGTGGSCTLAAGSCQVAYTPSAVGSGTHTLTAAYAGDGGHAASQATTTVTVTAPPSGGGGGGGGGGGTLLAPVVRLTSPARERMARTRVVTVTVTSDSAATFVAHGTLTVPGAAKVLTLRGVTGSLVAKTARTIRLRLSARQVRAVKRALRLHRKVTARVTLRVRNGAGATTAARTITARP